MREEGKKSMIIDFYDKRGNEQQKLDHASFSIFSTKKVLIIDKSLWENIIWGKYIFRYQ